MIYSLPIRRCSKERVELIQLLRTQVHRIKIVRKAPKKPDENPVDGLFSESDVKEFEILFGSKTGVDGNPDEDFQNFMKEMNDKGFISRTLKILEWLITKGTFIVWNIIKKAIYSKSKTTILSYILAAVILTLTGQSLTFAANMAYDAIISLLLQGTEILVNALTKVFFTYTNPKVVEDVSTHAALGPIMSVAYQFLMNLVPTGWEGMIRPIVKTICFIMSNILKPFLNIADKWAGGKIGSSYKGDTPLTDYFLSFFPDWIAAILKTARAHAWMRLLSPIFSGGIKPVSLLLGILAVGGVFSMGWLPMVFYLLGKVISCAPTIFQLSQNITQFRMATFSTHHAYAETFTKWVGYANPALGVAVKIWTMSKDFLSSIGRGFISVVCKLVSVSYTYMIWMIKTVFEYLLGEPFINALIEKVKTVFKDCMRDISQPVRDMRMAVSRKVQNMGAGCNSRVVKLLFKLLSALCEFFDPRNLTSGEIAEICLMTSRILMNAQVAGQMVALNKESEPDVFVGAKKMAIGPSSQERKVAADQMQTKGSSAEDGERLLAGYYSTWNFFWVDAQISPIEKFKTPGMSQVVTQFHSEAQGMSLFGTQEPLINNTDEKLEATFKYETNSDLNNEPGWWDYLGDKINYVASETKRTVDYVVDNTTTKLSTTPLLNSKEKIEENENWYHAKDNLLTLDPESFPHPELLTQEQLTEYHRCVEDNIMALGSKDNSVRIDSIKFQINRLGTAFRRDYDNYSSKTRATDHSIGLHEGELATVDFGEGLNAVKMAEIRGGHMDATLDISTMVMSTTWSSIAELVSDYPEGIFIQSLTKIVKNEQVVKIMGMIGALVDFEPTVTSKLIRTIFHSAHALRNRMYYSKWMLGAIHLFRMWVSHQDVAAALVALFDYLYIKKDNPLRSAVVETLTIKKWLDLKKKLIFCLSFDIQNKRTNRDINAEAQRYSERFTSTNNELIDVLQKFFIKTARALVELDWGWQYESISISMGHLEQLLQSDMLDAVFIQVLKHRLSTHYKKIEDKKISVTMQGVKAGLTAASVGAIIGLLSFSISAVQLS